MTNSNEYLDPDELFHIAAKAMDQNAHEAVLVYLKRCLSIRPDHPQAHYMLGVEYAQIGMLDRAIQEMQTGLQLEPKMELARFQLGFLLLTIGRTDEATAIWKDLDALGDEHPFSMFKKGLTHMARNEIEEGKKWIGVGMDRNTIYPALNDSMKALLAQVAFSTQHLPEGEQSPRQKVKAEDEQGPHFVAAAYSGMNS